MAFGKHEVNSKTGKEQLWRKIHRLRSERDKKEELIIALRAKIKDYEERCNPDLVDQLTKEVNDLKKENANLKRSNTMLKKNN